MTTKDDVIKVLKKISDPEIPINIVDLGLIYDVKVEKGVAKIKMTLTTPGCPLADVLEKRVKEALTKLPGIKNIKINLVWDPPWSPTRMSKEAKAKLGLR